MTNPAAPATTAAPATATTTGPPEPLAQPDADASPPTDQQQPEPADDAEQQDDDGGEDDDQDDQDDAEQQDDADKDGGTDRRSASREAAQWRRKFRDADDARISAEVALAMQQSDLIDAAVADAGYPPQFSEIIESSGVKVADLLDERGVVDRAKLASAIKDTAKAFGLQPKRPPRPTRGQGVPSGSGGVASWADLFGKVTGR
jgi:hypothetical protein